MKRLFLLIVLCLCGCAESEPASRPIQQFEPGSKVMTEEYRQAVTNQMAKQGVDKTEADIFTRELNNAQREWESSRR